MITQNSNNKPSGFTGKTCDSGTPISGRTDQNEYQIIKVNNDGSLATGGTYIATTNPYIAVNPTLTVVPAGAPASGTYLSGATVTVTEEGIYTINPTFIFDGNGGGISFILAKQGTALGTYITGLPLFNLFLPTIANLVTGFFGYWHNTANQILGGSTNSVAYNRNNAYNMFLEAGTYTLIAFTDGAVTLNGGGTLLGFYDFTKIA